MAGEREGRRAVLNRALALITEAMDLLDAHNSDPQAASYAALAQQRLRTALVQSEQSE
jgi:hypothetical protein